MAKPLPERSERTVYCLVCMRSHQPPVAVAIKDRCPSVPDLMTALEESLVASDERQADA